MLKQKLISLNQKVLPQKLFYAPKWLVLGVNNTCNLHCKMCDVGVEYQNSNFYQNLVGTTPLHMPLDLFKNIADQTKKFFPNTKLGYAFTEPLVYKHLYESLLYANELNLFTSITTNALNLRKWSDQLIDAGLNELFVSLDGPPDVHNEIRGYKLSFEKALEGITYLLSKSAATEVSVFCVITEWNIGRLTEFLNLFVHLPIKEIGFMHTNYTPESVASNHNLQYGQLYHATASNMLEINLDKYDLQTLFKEISDIKKTNYPFKVTFSPDIVSEQQLNVFYKEPEKFYGKKCYDAFSTLMIKSNGDVIPAHGRCYNLKSGNMYEQSLPQIWNSSILAKFRKDLNDAGGLLPACSRCCSAFN